MGSLAQFLERALESPESASIAALVAAVWFVLRRARSFEMKVTFGDSGDAAEQSRKPEEKP